MGLEGVSLSHHTLPTPMGQSQSTTARDRESDEEERAQHQHQQQQQTTGEKNYVNANANSISACSSSTSNLNINPLSGSSSKITSTFNRPASYFPAVSSPASSAHASTPVPRPQVNGGGNVSLGNGHGPPRAVGRIPWPPARPISSPVLQPNGGAKVTTNLGNGNGPPRRKVEFIPFEPHKSVHRGPNNTNSAPTPRAPRPQTIFTSSTATAGTVIQPPTVNAPPAAPAAQPTPPPLNGSTDQSNMGRPKTTTAPPNMTKTSTAPLNGAAPTTAPINAPLAPAASTTTPITKVTKVTATATATATVTGTPKLKRKAAQTPRGGGAKRSRKRKFAKFDDDEDVIRVGDTSTSSDESDDPTPATTMTKSGRQVHRPTAFVPPFEPQQEVDVSTAASQEKQQPQKKKRRTYRKGRENNVTCVRCWRGHSPASNAIVFCDECNGAWHQFCHDPPIENEVIIVKEAQWFCRECRPVENGAVSRSLQDRPVPNDVFPVASQVLVGGERFTREQRRGYLAGLPHAALVKLLFDVSNSQPDLAIFPENMLELPSATVLPPLPPPKVSKASLDLSTSTPITSIPTTSPAVPSTTVSPPPQSIPPPAPQQTTTAPTTTIQTTTIEDGPEDESLYADHRLYPRAGNGFRLPPDTADLDMLLEDPSCTTFSHALHGRAKARLQTEMEAGGVQVVGGFA